MPPRGLFWRIHGKRKEKDSTQAEQAQQMRLLALWTLWIAAWTLPQFAGAWWDEYFQIMQAGVSFGLLLASLMLLRAWWSEIFGYLCILQILLNVGDALFGYPATHYNLMLDFLNLSEFIVLFLIGSIATLHGMRGHGNNHRDGDSHLRRVPSGRS